MSRPAPQIPRLAYRYAELPGRLGYSLVTIKRHAAAGTLPTVHLAKRLRVVPVDGLAQLLGTAPLEVEGDALLSGPQVAVALGISNAQAHRLTKAGILPSVPWSSTRRVPLARLRTFLLEQMQGGEL